MYYISLYLFRADVLHIDLRRTLDNRLMASNAPSTPLSQCGFHQPISTLTFRAISEACQPGRDFTLDSGLTYPFRSLSSDILAPKLTNFEEIWYEFDESGVKLDVSLLDDDVLQADLLARLVLGIEAHEAVRVQEWIEAKQKRQYDRRNAYRDGELSAEAYWAEIVREEVESQNEDRRRARSITSVLSVSSPHCAVINRFRELTHHRVSTAGCESEALFFNLLTHLNIAPLYYFIFPPNFSFLYLTPELYDWRLDHMSLLRTAETLGISVYYGVLNDSELMWEYILKFLQMTDDNNNGDNKGIGVSAFGFVSDRVHSGYDLLTSELQEYQGYDGYSSSVPDNQ